MRPEFFEEKNLKLQDKIYSFAENHSAGKLGHVVVAPITEVGSALLDVSAGCAKVAESVTCVAVNLLEAPFSSTARGDIKESFKGIFTGLYQGTIGAIPRIGSLFKNVFIDMLNYKNLKGGLEERHDSRKKELEVLVKTKLIRDIERHPKKANDEFFNKLLRDSTFDRFVEEAKIPWENISDETLEKYCDWDQPRRTLLTHIGKKAPDRAVEFLMSSETKSKPHEPNLINDTMKRNEAHWMLFNVLPNDKKRELIDNADLPPEIIEFLFEQEDKKYIEWGIDKKFINDQQDHLMDKWAQEVREGRYPSSYLFWSWLSLRGTEKFENWDDLPWSDLNERFNKLKGPEFRVQNPNDQLEVTIKQYGQQQLNYLVFNYTELSGDRFSSRLTNS